MQFKSSFAFDHPPEVVREYLADEKSLAYIIENHPEIQSLEVLRNQEEGEKLFVEIKYTLDVPMPGPVKKVLGGVNTFVVELILDTKNNTGTMEFTPSKMAGKIKAGGRILFDQKGNKWLQTVDGDVTVKIFGVGKLVEKFIAESFKKSFEIESRLRNEYINKNRKA